MARTKKGQNGSGEPDCPQRDLIMNHNERAGAYKHAMESRISRWRVGDGCLTFIYVKLTIVHVHTLVLLHNVR